MKKSFKPIMALLVLSFIGFYLAKSEKTPKWEGDRSIASDNKLELKEVYESFPASSCEAIYYGLFLDGDSKLEKFEAPGFSVLHPDNWKKRAISYRPLKDESKDPALKVFNMLKRVYERLLEDDSQFPVDSNQVREEWQKRVDGAFLGASGGLKQIQI